MRHKQLLYKILDKRTAKLKEELASLCRDKGSVEVVAVTAQIAELAIIKSLFEILAIAQKHGGFSESLVNLLDELDYTETFLEALGNPNAFLVESKKKEIS